MRNGLVSAVLLTGLAGVLGWSSPAAGRTYYVSPNGSDANAGISPSRPWRSIERVNRAALQPGDVVRFRGSAEYRGSHLVLRRSGLPGRPITFSQYGTGWPTIQDGVFLDGVSHVALRRLRIEGDPQGVAAARSGPGSRHVDVIGNRIVEAAIAVNSPNPKDGDWLIARNSIASTDDSAIILEGARQRVVENRIHGAGADPGITYGKHGVYLKGPDGVVTGNDIGNFSDEGVSTRYRNALIEGNDIHDGEGGIGYYRNDADVGITRLRHNRIWNVSYGIYIARADSAGPTLERFEIVDNAVQAPIDVPDDPLAPVECRGNRADQPAAGRDWWLATHPPDTGEIFARGTAPCP
jgi:hypothetical protein